VIAQHIETIVESHERILDGEFHTDVAFNLAQVLVDYGEDTGQELVLQRGLNIWDKILDEQKRKLVNSRERLTENYTESSETVEDDEDEVTQAAVLETVVGYLGAIESYNEVLRGNNGSSENAGLATARSKGDELCELVGEVLSHEDESLNDALAHEAMITVAQWRCIDAATPQQVDDIWNSGQLPEISERFLEQANCYITLGDKNYSDLWTAYTRAAQSLSKASELATTPLIKKRAWMARGDVDVLRARLDVPAAVRNRDVLLKNAGVFYQNTYTADSLAANFDNSLLAAEARVKKAVVDAGLEVTDAVAALPLASRVVSEMRDQALL
jgi:hypothetical protein